MAGECPSRDRAAQIEAAVREKYRAVARRPDGQFGYPVGREGAERLGYEGAWLDRAPADVVAGFVGVGNPFGVRRPDAGQRVLDAGCGCGLDSYVASMLVGAAGAAVGVDLSEEMLERPRRGLPSWTPRNLEFRAGSIADLPFEDASFDLVVSNGVLNLVPDKDAAFREIARVLRPGGTFAAADLLVVADVPQALLADMDAWST